MGSGLGLNGLALAEIAPGTGTELPAPWAAQGPPHEDHQPNP